MKINKIFLASIFILAIITLGAVSATDELTAYNDDSLSTADEIDLQAAADDAAVSEDGEDEYVTIYSIDGDEILSGDEHSIWVWGNTEENFTVQNFNFTIDDNDYKFTYDSENDELVFNTSGLSIGTHDYAVNFLGKGKYVPTFSSGSFEIIKYDLNFPEIVVYGSSGMPSVWIVTPLSDVDSTLTVLIGDETLSKKIEEDDAHGSAVISLYDFNMTEGKHNMTIKLNDEVIANQEILAVLEISVPDVFMVYGDEEFNIGEIKGLDISEITVNINGISYPIYIDEKEGNTLLHVTDVYGLNPGVYDIQLEYTGDRFSYSVFNGTLEIKPVLSAPYIVEGNPETDVFRLVLPDGVKGNLLIYVKKSSEEWPTTMNGWNKLFPYANVTLGGETIIPIENLSYGMYDYEWRTEGYEGPKFIADSSFFTVNPNITLPTEQVMFGENATISIDLPNRNGTLTLAPRGKDSAYISEVPLVNGKATINIPNLKVGINRFTVFLDLDAGEYDFEYYSWYVDVSVKPNLTLPTGKVGLGDKLYVTVDLPGYNGTLTVTEAVKEGVGGQADLVDGKASVLIPKLDRLGNLTYAVGLYLSHYDQFENVVSDLYIYEGTLEVVYPYTIVVTPMFTRYDSGNAFTVTVVDADNNTVKGVQLMLKVYTGKTFKKYFITTNDEGVASFDIASTLDIGIHDVAVSSTNQNFTAKKVYTTIQVAKAKTIVNAPAVTVKFKKSDYFKVKIKNKATRKPVAKVKIKLRIFTGSKYKTFTVKTSKYGNAVFNTKDLSIGKHKVVIYTIDGRYKIGAKSVIYVKK